MKKLSLKLLLYGLAAAVCGWGFGAEGAHAQAPSKFGDLTPRDFETMNIAGDTTVPEAVVLFETGKIFYDYQPVKNSFQQFREIHCRIKINTSEGFAYANQECLLHRRGTNMETLNSFRAFTYNLVNGKIVKTKLDKSSVSREEVDENRVRYKFSFPEVREGSVIEFYYRVFSDFLAHIPAWTFQRDIPTLYSEYEVSLPEFLRCQRHYRGYLPALQFDSKQVAPPSPQMDYRDNFEHFVIRNVPAFREEPFMDSKYNYVPSVEYEVKAFIYRTVYEDYSMSWASLDKTLLEDDRFGKQIRRSAYFSKDLPGILANAGTETEKIRAVLEFVKQKMKWNGALGCFVGRDRTVAEAYKNGTGNSAEVNIVLLSMLQAAGIKARPVVLSTRESGWLSKSRPSLSALNYLVVMAEGAEGKILLDATEPFSDFNVLPERAYNRQGRFVDKDSADWVDLSPAAPATVQVVNTYALAPDGRAAGSTLAIYRNNFALEQRKAYSEKTETEIEEEFRSRSKLAGVDSIRLDNLHERTDEPFLVSFRYRELPKGTPAGDLVFVTPFSWHKFDTNPFKSEDRYYPVNFAYPRSYAFQDRITVPAGYTVHELPPDKTFGMPGGKAVFTVRYQSVGPQILAQSLLRFNRAEYAPEDYKALRTFMSLVIAEQEKQIVLKKATAR